MEFAIPGFIQRFCTPNALTTLMEYMVDYASPETRTAGEESITRELGKLPETPQKAMLVERLGQIRQTDARDLYF
jgi:2-iminoacetate synthase